MCIRGGHGYAEVYLLGEGASGVYNSAQVFVGVGERNVDRFVVLCVAGEDRAVVDHATAT